MRGVHRNDLLVMNALKLIEVTATAGGCGDCWKPLRVGGNMMENALSILIVIFPHNSNKLRPQTESSSFSDLGPGLGSIRITKNFHRLIFFCNP